MTLFAHQRDGISWLIEREGAGLFHEMGCGKSRTAIFAAVKLFERPQAKRSIDRVLILAPASVCFAWREELKKLSTESSDFRATVLRYDSKQHGFFCDEVLGSLDGTKHRHIPIAVVSYGLVQNGKHAKVLQSWCLDGNTVL